MTGSIPELASTTMARAAAVGLLVGLALVAAACGVEEPPELPPLRGGEPGENRADTTADDPDVDPEPVDRSSTHLMVELPEPTITILDLGADPRRELRLNMVQGTEGLSTTRSRTVQQVFIDDAPASPETTTSNTVTIRARVLEVADGVATVERQFNDVALVERGMMSPDDIAEFEDAMESMVGHSIFVAIDDRGTALRAEVPRDLPTELLGDHQDFVEGYSPSLPFPVEAVGVGARWQVDYPPMQAPTVPVTTVTEFELMELHDDHVVMRVNVHTTIEAHSMEAHEGNIEFLDPEVHKRGTITRYFDAAGLESTTRTESIMGVIETVDDERITTEVRQRLEVIATFES